jgi:mRNA interferase RelE/StbE
MTSQPTRWTIRFDPRALKNLRALGSSDRARVVRFLDERIARSEDPRHLGTALQGEHAGTWRYRVGDIRIIVRIEFGELVVLVLEVGNRRDIYR